jgi:hypothetical protein
MSREQLERYCELIAALLTPPDFGVGEKALKTVG